MGSSPDDLVRAADFSQVRTPISLLTEHERVELESWSLDGFRQLNAALREEIPMTPEISMRIEMIRAALKKAPLEWGTRVTRRVGWEMFAEQSDLALVVGQTLRLAGFVSTSMAQEPPPIGALPNSETVVLDLLILQGVPAFALGELAEFPLEKEMLVIDAPEVFFTGLHSDEDVGPRLRGIVSWRGETA